MQTTPRFVKPGSTQILSDGPAFIQSVTLTAKTGGASLSLWASATSTINATLTNRLLIRAGGISSPATVNLDLGGSLWPTGITVSCGGVGARAVVFMNNRTRA